MQRTLTIVDNFYTNPNEVREYALSLPYSVRGNYPGYRTKSFLGTSEAESTKKRFEDILNIDIYNWDNLGEDSYNTAFQLTYDCDKTWIHRDINEYAGVLYLTPDAPCSGGTSFYRHIETNTKHMNPLSENPEDKKILEILDRDSNDLTKWERTDYAANYFNRLILFKGWNNHRSHFHFGRSNEPSTGRLFQVFFFDGTPRN